MTASSYADGKRHKRLLWSCVFGVVVLLMAVSLAIVVAWWTFQQLGDLKRQHDEMRRELTRLKSEFQRERRFTIARSKHMMETLSIVVAMCRNSRPLENADSSPPVEKEGPLAFENVRVRRQTKKQTSDSTTMAMRLENLRRTIYDTNERYRYFAQVAFRRQRNGPTGPQGPPGPPGHSGTNGMPGPPGFPGASGMAGPPGVDGRHGREGKPGSNGIPGVHGFPGERGEKGEHGFAGRPGLDGHPGPIGHHGMTGLSGSKGRKGEKGESCQNIEKPKYEDEVLRREALASFFRHGDNLRVVGQYTRWGSSACPRNWNTLIYTGQVVSSKLNLGNDTVGSNVLCMAVSFSKPRYRKSLSNVNNTKENAKADQGVNNGFLPITEDPPFHIDSSQEEVAAAVNHLDPTEALIGQYKNLYQKTQALDHEASPTARLLDQGRFSSFKHAIDAERSNLALISQFVDAVEDLPVPTEREEQPPPAPNFHNELFLNLKPTTSSWSTSDQSTSSVQTPSTPVYRSARGHLWGTRKYIPCAVCGTTNRPIVRMIPGTDECPVYWKTEYKGHLMAFHHHSKQSEIICVDQNALGVSPEDDPRLQAMISRYMSPVTSDCQSLPCPPYEPDVDLKCAVCSM